MKYKPVKIPRKQPTTSVLDEYSYGWNDCLKHIEQRGFKIVEVVDETEAVWFGN